MEIVTDLVNNQLAIYLPVVFVIVVVILVFACSIKNAEQPPFDKLTSDERKQAGKKRKIKEKKVTTNGHVSTGESKSEKSPVKESKRSPNKENVEKKEKEIKKEAPKPPKREENKPKTVEEVKNKKNAKKVLKEKPVDFDEGNWETVPSKSDKKKKQEQSPAKKEKKSKKNDEKNGVLIEKYAKEVVSTMLKEKEKDEEKDVKIEKEVEKEPAEEVPIIEEKKEKKKEKKPKKDNSPPTPTPAAPVTPAKEEEEIAEIKEQPKSEVVPPPPAKPAPAETDKTITNNNPEGGVVFDEIGDVWTEAKAVKKSKKKTRKDN